MYVGFYCCFVNSIHCNHHNIFRPNVQAAVRSTGERLKSMPHILTGMDRPYGIKAIPEECPNCESLSETFAMHRKWVNTSRYPFAIWELLVCQKQTDNRKLWIKSKVLTTCLLVFFQPRAHVNQRQESAWKTRWVLLTFYLCMLAIGIRKNINEVLHTILCSLFLDLLAERTRRPELRLSWWFWKLEWRLRWKYSNSKLNILKPFILP